MQRTQDNSIHVTFIDDNIKVGWSYNLCWKGDSGSSDGWMDEDTPEIFSSTNTLVAKRFDLKLGDKLYYLPKTKHIVYDGVIYELME